MGWLPSRSYQRWANLGGDLPACLLYDEIIPEQGIYSASCLVRAQRSAWFVQQPMFHRIFCSSRSILDFYHVYFAVEFCRMPVSWMVGWYSSHCSIGSCVVRGRLWILVFYDLGRLFDIAFYREKKNGKHQFGPFQPSCWPEPSSPWLN